MESLLHNPNSLLKETYVNAVLSEKRGATSLCKFPNTIPFANTLVVLVFFHLSVTKFKSHHSQQSERDQLHCSHLIEE